MDKKIMDSICKLIETEIERLSKQPSLDNTTLNQLHVLTDTKKNLLKIETLEMELGESDMDDMGGSYRRGGRSYRGNSYDYIRGEWGNSMTQGQQGGNSNRYSMNGPYYGSYDNGYSRHDSYSHLEEAMRNARSEQEREEIRNLMTRLYK